MVQGLPEKEAVDKAIVQMGDTDLIGKQLNKVHKPKPVGCTTVFLPFYKYRIISVLFYPKARFNYIRHL